MNVSWLKDVEKLVLGPIQETLNDTVQDVKSRNVWDGSSPQTRWSIIKTVLKMAVEMTIVISGCVIYLLTLLTAVGLAIVKPKVFERKSSRLFQHTRRPKVNACVEGGDAGVDFGDR